MQVNSSLMALVDESLILWDQLTNEEGELVENAEELLGLTEGKISDKVDIYASLIRRKEDQARFLKEEAARLNALAAREEKNAGWLAVRLMAAMNRLGTRKIEAAYHVVSLVKNGGKVPLVVAIHPSELPEDLRKVKVVETTTPDNDKIRAKLEAGDKVGGCSLGERGERLVIK